MPAFRHLFILLFLWLTYACGAYAQDNIKGEGVGIETNLIGGKVFKHSPKFTLPIPEHSEAIEVNFIWKTHGKKDWQQRRHYPVVGFGITYTNYGVDSVYGKAIGIYPDLQIPIITGNKLEWTLRMGFGAAYVTKMYERAPSFDTLNDAIGSHINNFTIFRTDLRYHVNQHLDIQVGANFSHMSNASFTQPNLGINMYGAHIGLRYFPVTSRPKLIVTDQKPLKSRWLFEVRPGFSFDGYAAPNGPAFPVYLASAYCSKRWQSQNKFFFGVDYSYHTAIYAFLRNNEILPGQEASYSWKSAVFAGNEFLVGRVGIILQVGVYLKQAYLKQDPYYEKLGANYYLLQREKGPLKELFISALLKTHKTVAELAEFGIGFGF